MPAGGLARIAFWTVVASSREALLDAIDRHRDANAFTRATTLAWTQAQVQLRHLDIDAVEASYFQRLAGHACLTAFVAYGLVKEALARGGEGALRRTRQGPRQSVAGAAADRGGAGVLLFPPRACVGREAGLSPPRLGSASSSSEFVETPHPGLRLLPWLDSFSPHCAASLLEGGSRRACASSCLECQTATALQTCVIAPIVCGCGGAVVLCISPPLVSGVRNGRARCTLGLMRCRPLPAGLECIRIFGGAERACLTFRITRCFFGCLHICHGGERSHHRT